MRGQHSARAVELEGGPAAEVVVVAAAEFAPDVGTFVVFETVAQMFASWALLYFVPLKME